MLAKSCFCGLCWWFVFAPYIGLTGCVLWQTFFLPKLEFPIIAGVEVAMIVHLYLLARAWKHPSGMSFWCAVSLYFGALLFIGVTLDMASQHGMKWTLVVLQAVLLAPLHLLLRHKINRTPETFQLVSEAQKTKMQHLHAGQDTEIKYQGVTPGITFAQIFGMTNTKSRLKKAGLEIVDSFNA